MPNSHILEYATKEHNQDLLLAKISEYGKTLISENAVEVISKNFLKK